MIAHHGITSLSDEEDSAEAGPDRTGTYPDSIEVRSFISFLFVNNPIDSSRLAVYLHLSNNTERLDYQFLTIISTVFYFITSSLCGGICRSLLLCRRARLRGGCFRSGGLWCSLGLGLGLLLSILYLVTLDAVDNSQTFSLSRQVV